MTIYLKPALLAIKAHLDAQADINEAMIGEPRRPCPGLTVAIVIDRYETPEVTLSGTCEKRRVVLRAYRSATAEPIDETEFALDRVMSDLKTSLMGDFQLGGSGIRDIEPITNTVSFGYQDIGGVKHRVASMFVSMTIDDSASFNP